MHTMNNPLRRQNHATWYLSTLTILLNYNLISTPVEGEETGKGKRHRSFNLLQFLSYDEPKTLIILGQCSSGGVWARRKEGRTRSIRWACHQTSKEKSQHVHLRIISGNKMCEVCAAHFNPAITKLEKKKTLKFQPAALLPQGLFITLNVAQEKTIQSETKLVHPE